MIARHFDLRQFAETDLQLVLHVALQLLLKQRREHTIGRI